MTVHIATGALFATGYLAGAGGTLRPEQAFGSLGELVLDALPASVYLFFALSGFLITRPFVEAFVAGGPLPSLRSYARNRALRIFPAAWAPLAFVLIHDGDRGSSPVELLSALTLPRRTPRTARVAGGVAVVAEVEPSFYLLVRSCSCRCGGFGGASRRRFQAGSLFRGRHRGMRERRPVG